MQNIENPKEAPGSKKISFSAVPATVLSEVALGMTEGARKYGRHNYRTTKIVANVDIKQMVEHNLMLIADATKCIAELQDRCTHEGLQGQFRADAGNYDPSCNIYWVELSCPVCGKRWDEYQSDIQAVGKAFQTKDGFTFVKIP